MSDKPRPVPTAWSEPFWEAARRGEFILQRCGDCGSYVGYPKIFCTACYSDNLGWERASGNGKLYSYSTVTANPPSAFIDDIPYTIAIVELEEGPRFLSRLIDLDPEHLHCELPVEIAFVHVDDELVMPFFRARSGS